MNTPTVTTDVIPRMKYVASATDGSKHHVGISSLDGKVYTWGKSNSFGQLGRTGKTNTPLRANLVHIHHQNHPRSSPSSSSEPQAFRVYAGGIAESGHSAVLDSYGTLWLTGCDRWQQLGLGSTNGGASGYTWENGKLWQESFRPIHHLNDELLNDSDEKTGGKIRDVALGGDHTVILSSNQRDVITFGKGGEGQLGHASKPFVFSPARSKELSLSKKSRSKKIAAVCAISHCSLTLDEEGKILNAVGKCKRTTSDFKVALEACLRRASKNDLLDGRTIK